MKLKKLEKLLTRPAETQQASRSISACAEALMTVKTAPSTPSHQAKSAAERAVEYLLRKITDFSLQMVDSKQRMTELNLPSNQIHIDRLELLASQVQPYMLCGQNWYLVLFWGFMVWSLVTSQNASTENRSRRKQISWFLDGFPSFEVD